MKYKVIDNFLDKEYFDQLQAFFTTDENNDDKKVNNENTMKPPVMTWTFCKEIVLGDVSKLKDQNNLFYMTHMIYCDMSPVSRIYERVIPLFKKMGVRSLIRVKANFFPNTHTLYEHPMHTDTDFSHSGAILSLNTCDGYTKLKDGTKIDSVANRILLFDASNEHCSTTTTNVSARINININYF